MTSQRELHYRYILGILGFVVIGLVTVKWSSVPDLADQFGFALTLTSLVLAVLAIVYAFVSSSSISSNLIRLDTATEKLSASAGVLVTVGEGIEEGFRQVPAMIDDVGRRLDSTQAAIVTLAQSPRAGAKESGDRDTLVQRVMGPHVAVSLLLTLYAAMLARKLGRTIITHSLMDGQVLIPTPYAYGVLVALDTTGVLRFTSVEVAHDDRVDPLKYTPIRIDHVVEGLTLDGIRGRILELSKKTRVFERAKESISEIEQWMETAPLDTASAPTRRPPPPQGRL